MTIANGVFVFIVVVFMVFAVFGLCVTIGKSLKGIREGDDSFMYAKIQDQKALICELEKSIEIQKSLIDELSQLSKRQVDNLCKKDKQMMLILDIVSVCECITYRELMDILKDWDT